MLRSRRIWILDTRRKATVISSSVRPYGCMTAFAPEGVFVSEGGYMEDGLRLRQEVLGGEHVRRSLEQASDFSRPMQELATEFCWGRIWSRPGLTKRDRSLLNLVMLAALNRSHELGVHVRGALQTGCTVEEIQEALLQAAAYCGVPAGLEAFRVAERVLDEELPRVGGSASSESEGNRGISHG